VSEVTWRTLDGETFSLADYSGKVVLLNFWATWCGPCRRELPGLNNVAEQLTSDNFAVVAINIDTNPEETAETFADRLELNALELFIDPELRSTNVLGLRSMPSTYLFDGDGKLIGKLEGGAEWDAPESIDLLVHYANAAGGRI
jgi:thiol-disulfide isomerase/thioredoxin